MCGAGGALPPAPHPPAVGPPGGASSASGTDGTPGFCSGRGLPPLRSSLSQILIRNRATDLDARMHDGTTPLILAARLAVEGMLEDLINSHADVNAVDDLGKPGPQPSGGGGGGVPGRLLLPSRTLLPHAGKSALHWAAAVNNVEAAVVLLKNGANKDMQNNKVGGQRVPRARLPTRGPYRLGLGALIGQVPAEALGPRRDPQQAPVCSATASPPVPFSARGLCPSAVSSSSSRLICPGDLALTCLWPSRGWRGDPGGAEGAKRWGGCSSASRGPRI